MIEPVEVLLVLAHAIGGGGRQPFVHMGPRNVNRRQYVHLVHPDADPSSEQNSHVIVEMPTGAISISDQLRQALPTRLSAQTQQRGAGDANAGPVIGRHAWTFAPEVIEHETLPALAEALGAAVRSLPQE